MCRASRKRRHCISAWGCDRALTTGSPRPSRQWRTGWISSLLMRRPGRSHKRSLTSCTMPPSEFSTGSTAASISREATASKTREKVGNPTVVASGNAASAASSEYAPGSPWYPTRLHATDDMVGNGTEARSSRLNRRRAQPVVRRRRSLVRSRPWRRCEAEKAQRAVHRRAKLKRPTCRDHERIACAHCDRLDAGRIGAWRAAPDHAITLEEVPDLLHVPMLHRPGSLPRAERRLAQARGGRALRLSHDGSDIGPVGGA